MYVCMYVCKYACMHVCMHVVCVPVFSYIFTNDLCMYTYEICCSAFTAPSTHYARIFNERESKRKSVRERGRKKECERAAERERENCSVGRRHSPRRAAYLRVNGGQAI